jgi:MFS family permease
MHAADPLKNTAPVSLLSYKAELREGYAYLLRTRLLLGVTVMVMATNGIDQGWGSVLLPLHTRQELGGAADLGLLTALFGAGGLLGALLYGTVGHRFPRRAVFTVAFLLCGAPRFLVAALTSSTLPLAVTMALGGLAGGMLNPILTTITYERVPQELRSRVSGVLTAGCELAMPVGGLGAGLLAEEAGASGALLIVGGLYFLVTLSPLVFPAWRTMDDAPGLSSSEPSRPSSAPEASRPRPSTS